MLPVLLLLTAAAADPVTVALDPPARVLALDNGMRVAIVPDPGQPLVALHLLVAVGSADDPPGAEGTAHLVEHLLFEASGCGPGPDRRLGALGGDANAWTDLDWTAFHAVIPPAALESALALEAERLAAFPTALAPEVLATEAAVVRLEAAQDAASGRGDDARALSALLWPEGHPYAHPILGPPSRPDDPWTPDAIRAFFADHYVPGAMTFVLVGAVDPDAAEDVVRRTLGAVPPRPAAGRVEKAAPPPPDHEVRAFHAADVSTRTLYVAWRTAPPGHPDLPALEVAARLLAAGRGGRLDEPLVYRASTARRVDAWVDHRLRGSAFAIRVAVGDDLPLDAALAVVDREVARLAGEGPTEAEMGRVRGALRGAWLRAVEPIAARAALLDRCLAETGDPGCLAEGLAARLAVTPEDVRRTVATWLPPGRRVLLSVVPASEPGAALPGSRVLALPDVPAPPPSPPRGLPPDPARPPAGLVLAGLDLPAVEEVALAGGGRLLVVPRPGLPLVRVEATILNDPARDSPGDLLALRLAGALLDNGTRRRDAAALAADLDRMGAILDTGAGPLGTRIAVEAPSTALATALDLLAEVLREPRFPAAEVRRVRGAWRASARRALGSADRILAAAEVRAIHPPDHPLGGLPTDADHRRLTRSRVRRAWREALHDGRLVVVAAGDLDAAVVASLVAARLGGTGGARSPSPLAAPPAVVRGPRVVLVDDPGSDEARIVLSLPTPGRGDPDLPLARLVAWVLGGGLDGRLDRRLRGAEGLVYAVEATVQAWPGHGRLRVVTRTPAAAGARVARLLLDEVAGVGVGISDADLDAARASLLRLDAEAEGTLAGLADRLGEEAAQGGGRDTWAADVRRIAGADLGAVRAVARRICRTEAATLVILADRDLLEPGLEQAEVFPTDLWSARRALEGPLPP